MAGSLARPDADEKAEDALTAPFGWAMANSFATYAEGWMPPWLQRPYGLKWSGSIGQEADDFVTRDQQGVLARYPDKTPVTGLSAVGFTRNLFQTFGDDSSGTKSRLWMKNAFTKDALTSPTPAVPKAPGWYYGGTFTGLSAALINSGFWTTDSLGNFVGPRFYSNRDWVSYAPDGTEANGVVTCASTIPHDPNTTPVGRLWLPDTAQHTVVITIASSGTAGTDGSASLVIDGGSPVALNPIPLQHVETIGSVDVQITFSGDFLVDDVYTVSSPDHRPGGWDRLWAVLPAQQVLNQLKWGSDSGWNWGAPPTGYSEPASWGAVDPVVGRNVAGMIRSIFRAWASGGTRLIGVWLVFGTDTEIDSIPTGTWDGYDITIGGETPVWVQFNTEMI